MSWRAVEGDVAVAVAYLPGSYFGVLGGSFGSSWPVVQQPEDMEWHRPRPERTHLPPSLGGNCCLFSVAASTRLSSSQQCWSNLLLHPFLIIRRGAN